MSASENVVRNVRGLMGENGVTQVQLGQWLGLSQAAVAKRISTRTVIFDIEELAVVADRFGVSIQSLFDPPRTPVPFQSVGTVTREYQTDQSCYTLAA